jgi:hypothetical protein
LPSSPKKSLTFLAALTVLSIGFSAFAQSEQELAKSTESLSDADADAIRRAIDSSGPVTASPSLERPHPRILIVPKTVESLYATKPKATVRLLLNIVDHGEPWDSIHASACIYALVWAPEFGSIVTNVNTESWDHPIAAGRETYRRFTYNRCVRLIAKREEAKAKKDEEGQPNGPP